MGLHEPSRFPPHPSLSLISISVSLNGAIVFAGSSLLDLTTRFAEQRGHARLFIVQTRCRDLVCCLGVRLQPPYQVTERAANTASSGELADCRHPNPRSASTSAADVSWNDDIVVDRARTAWSPIGMMKDTRIRKSAAAQSGKRAHFLEPQGTGQAAS